MPTRPRNSCESGISACGNAIVVLPSDVSFCSICYSYFQSGSSGCFKSHSGRRLRTTGMRRKVVIRRRRSGGPLQRPGIPWIIARRFAFEVRPEDRLHHPEQDADDLKNHADGNDQVPDLPSAARLVGINAARHAQHAGNVHEVEGKMEADQEQPEVPLAQRLARHPASDFGIPIVERRENGEHDPADQ